MKLNAGVPIQALPSLNVIGVLDDWLDTVDVDSVRWTKRQHPDYQVSFMQQVRGQPLDIFIDYSAKTDFLGFYAYMRAFDSRGTSDLYALLNEVNLAAPYGALEYDPDSGKLRCRASVDIEGARITPTFLNSMLNGVMLLYDTHMDRLLPGLTPVPTGAEAGLVPRGAKC